VWKLGPRKQGSGRKNGLNVALAIISSYTESTLEPKNTNPNPNRVFKPKKKNPSCACREHLFVLGAFGENFTPNVPLTMPGWGLK